MEDQERQKAVQVQFDDKDSYIASYVGLAQNAIDN
jgi:hypothetical protein